MRPYYLFGLLDGIRRFQGNGMDLLGLGPKECPFSTVFERPGLRLRQYGAGDAGRTPLLIVPAPIKRPYIWDLAPERSVVRSALAHGLGVYLVEWTEPGQQAFEHGLRDYAGAMLADCVAFIQERAGARQVFLAGHSLGGIFAALHCACLPANIAALIVVDAPLDYAAAERAPTAPRAGIRAHLPGSLLSAATVHAAPGAFFKGRYADRLASLPSREHTLTHWRVERWTLDEQAMSRALFDDLADLQRHNRFMRGELAIDGTRLHPRKVTAPLFSICHPGGFIPAQSVTAFHQAAGSVDKELAIYPGDIGVALQHVGPLVGDNAHRHIWPRVFAWLANIEASPAPAALVQSM